MAYVEEPSRARNAAAVVVTFSLTTGARRP